MSAPAQYSSSDEELPESFQPARTPRAHEDTINPDLFYRLKLKLWNRDRMTDCIRCAYVEENDPNEDCAHWALGTRVVISDDNDHYTGKVGRIVEYRGKGIYAIVTEDGHKVCYSPLQFHRCADQKGPKKGTGNHVTLDLQTAIMASGPAIKAEESPRPEVKEAPPPQPAPSPHPQMAAGGGRMSVGSGGGGGGGGGGGAGKDTHLPTGTRVRIVRAYGGGALAKEDVKTGTTTTFTHGWYYIQLDDNAKQTSCRRHSFVVIGDEEDVGLGYAAEAEGIGGGGSGGGGGDGGGEGKGGGEGGGEDDKGRKRGRASRGGADEDEEEEEEEDDDDDEGGKRKKGKKDHKKGRARDDAEDKEKDEEERKRREREEEKKRKEKERKEREELERQREEEERRRAESELSQEDRDALEAARLAAMLNRNPRRRGGPDPAPPVHIPAASKPAPAKNKGASKPAKGTQEGSHKKTASSSAKDVPGKPGKKGKEDGDKGGSSISAQDIFGDEDEE